MAQDQKNKNLLARVKAWYDHVTHKDDPHYISGKEARRIARENFKITREYERKKRRRVSEQDYLSEMKNEDNILEIENLHTYFFTDAGVAKSVDGVSFEVPKRSVVGVVGESGCGKSVTSLSVMQLVQAPQGQIVERASPSSSGSMNKRASAFPSPCPCSTKRARPCSTKRPQRRSSVRRGRMWWSATSPSSAPNPL